MTPAETIHATSVDRSTERIGGGRMAVFGTNPAVERVMEVTRVNTLIAVVPTEQEAASILKSGN